MSSFIFDLPEYVNTALERLSAKGFSSFIVGGCVRDMLLGNMPKDFDMCTSATPLQIKDTFKDFQTIDTGIKHGTVTVIIDNYSIEITTFRKEDGYDDHRRPTNVGFTANLEEDLKRRDFTVNAMAYDKSCGLVDIFNGIGDLNNRLIKAVGNASKRFNEDALRMMRALRFSSVLEFTIEKNTANSIKRLCGDIKFVSKERICSELSKLLLGKSAKEVLINHKELIFEIIPDLKACFNTSQENPYHIYDVYTHSVHALDKVPPILSLRLCALLHDIGKSQCKTIDKNGVAHFLNHASISMLLADNILKDLKFDNKTRKECVLLIKLHDRPFPKSKNKLTKKMSMYGYDIMKKLIMIKKADILAQAPIFRDSRLKELEDAENHIDFIEQSGTCYTLKQLAISGHDLEDFPIDKRDYSKILNEVLHCVIYKQLSNERHSLLKFLTKKFK